MIFNSFSFLVFFLCLYFLYWLAFQKNLKAQNLLLLVASYVFYAWADWRFLGLLIAFSLINFYLGMYLAKATSDKQKKLLVNLGLIQGIGALLFFKYFHFFGEGLNATLGLFHLQVPAVHFKIIVPLGISFFTFRTISYLLDIRNGKGEATQDMVVFLNYVSFFPSILSGPIDRAKNFIPQLESPRTFDYQATSDGLRQILWGLFKKVVIADSCATMTNQIFTDYANLPASSLVLGAFLFTIQIYADFSGYSDMAIGVSRLLGFKVTKNFDFPFFAQNIADFWRKWHISLTSWLTEYVFTPLSIFFRDYGKAGVIAAILTNLTLMGIWHGPNWTFVLFGLVHGSYFIPLILKGTFNKKKKIAKDQVLPTLRELVNMAGVFTLVMFTFILFKSDTLQQALQYYGHLFSSSLFSKPVLIVDKMTALLTPLFMLLMIVIEWIGRDSNYGLEKFALKWKLPLRWAFYISLALLILIYQGKQQTFIYFQF